MTGDPTQRLIDALAADLCPVRRIPRLSLTVAAVLAVGAGVGTIVVAALGAGVELVPRDASCQEVLAGLVAAAVGGSLAGLASSIPGRGAASSAGAALAGVGLSGALAVAALSAQWGSLASVAPAAPEVSCMGWAVAFALAPTGVALAVVARGWAARASVAASLTLLGTASIGAIIVHLVCPIADMRHVMLGHCSSPLLLSGLGIVCVAPLIRRWAR